MTPELAALVAGLRSEASMGSGIQAKNALLRTAADALTTLAEERDAIQETLTQAEHDVAIVYCHITDGRISKINTDPQVVKSVTDDCVTELVNGELRRVTARAESAERECALAREERDTANRRSLGWEARVAALEAENALLKELLTQINECGQWPELCERCRDEVRALAGEGGDAK
jgi:hypothetical protein